MSTHTGTTPQHSPRSGVRFGGLQRFGKSLMLPIALLPAAGLLLRIGQDDVLGWITVPVIGPFFDAMTLAGDTIFKNLPLLFAVGIAIGLAKRSDGSTALAAVAGYLVLEGVFEAMSPIVLAGQTDIAGDPLAINYGVLGGVVVGLITAWLFDRYHDIELPTYLGFFGGRRFVPIVVSFTTLIAAFALAYCYPLFNAGLTGVATGITSAGAVGAFVYGVVNRLLIPFGLHHIVNTYVWFQYGTFASDTGVVHGELTRFAAGDPTAGLLTAGFYPILMFGLPGAALAMMHVARPEQRRIAAGIFGAAGLTAFLTGITEPLEFAFMFVAFPLYVLHAILTGLSLAVAYVLDIHLGFSFSAGLVDLVLYGTAPAAKNIPLLLAMGVAFFVLYYVLFRFAITRWNLRTPGRDEDVGGTSGPDDTAAPTGRDDMAHKLIDAFGGRDNLHYVDACITRLRIEVADKNAVSTRRLRSLGAAGVMEVGNNVQAVFGPRAESLRDDIRRVLADRSPEVAAPASADTVPVSDAPSGELTIVAPLAGRVVPLTDVTDPTFSQGTVGHGLAIEPEARSSGDTGSTVTVVAPVAGRVAQLWPHAFAIETVGGAGVLVHLGIDTVTLEGEGFTVRAAVGDEVEVGTRLVDYDVTAVAATGRDTIVPVVVLGATDEAITTVASAHVRALDALFSFSS